jgi:hypothetical protein
MDNDMDTASFALLRNDNTIFKKKITDKFGLLLGLDQLLALYIYSRYRFKNEQTWDPKASL